MNYIIKVEFSSKKLFEREVNFAVKTCKFKIKNIKDIFKKF